VQAFTFKAHAVSVLLDLRRNLNILGELLIPEYNPEKGFG
jgi:hypothetical protein